MSKKEVVKAKSQDPEVPSLPVKQIATVLGQAQLMIVRTEAQFIQCGELLRVIKGLRDDVSLAHDPVIKHWYLKHRAAIEEKKKDDGPLLEAETILKPKVATYVNDRARKLAEENARLQREAERDAEERRLAETVILIDEGRETEAEELLQQPIRVETAAIELSKPDSHGVPVRPNYSAKVTDLRKLVEAIVRGEVPIQAVEPDLVFLGQQARAMKEAFAYPGVELVKSSIVSVRR